MPAELHQTFDDGVFAQLMAAHCGPVTPGAQVDQCALGDRLAVAVSGGADSTALLIALAGWCRISGKGLLVITVDHGLREESAAEAEMVARLCKQLGIEHRTLIWSGQKPKAGRQEAAREARYRLLHETCLLEGIENLFLAHHADDQRETFMMRLLAASGYEGLAAMPAIGRVGSIKLHRPLLGVRKAALESYLRDRGMVWIEDPTNLDPAYLRSQLRKARAQLEDEGAPLPAFWEEICAFGRLRRMSDRAIANVISRALELSPAGYARLDVAVIRDAGGVLGPRVLGRLLQDLGGRPYPASPRTLDRLWAQLPLDRARTLSGCRLVPLDGRLLLCREAARVEPFTLKANSAGLWDRRYEVICGADLEEGLSLAPLGESGIAALRAVGQGEPLEQVPAVVRPALPTVFLGQRPLHALFLGSAYSEKPCQGLEIRYIAPQLSWDACFTVADP